MAKLKSSTAPQPLVISRLKVVAALKSCGNEAAVNDLDNPPTNNEMQEKLTIQLQQTILYAPNSNL